MSSQVLSLLQYFKQKELPDPDSPLSQSLHLHAITSANREAQEEMKMKNPLRNVVLTSSEHNIPISLALSICKATAYRSLPLSCSLLAFTLKFFANDCVPNILINMVASHTTANGFFHRLPKCDLYSTEIFKVLKKSVHKNFHRLPADENISNVFSRTTVIQYCN